MDTNNNRYSFPDLGGDGGIFTSSTNDLSIYPLPSALNCEGTVSALRYCYRLSNSDQFGNELTIFTLLTLEQNGTVFTVTNVIAVPSTPSGQICTGIPFSSAQRCCDTLPLDMVDQFHLPTSNFAFGLLLLDISLYRFSTFSVRVSHHRLSASPEVGSPAIGDTITVGDIVTDRSLRAFRFLLSESR